MVSLHFPKSALHKPSTCYLMCQNGDAAAARTVCKPVASCRVPVLRAANSSQLELHREAVR